MTPETAQNRANKRLQALGTYHAQVPLQALIDAVRNAGWTVDSKDHDTMIFHSAEGRMRIACWYRDTVREQAQDALHRLIGEEKRVPLTARYLNFTWYKMESGNYEIVAYLS